MRSIDLSRIPEAARMGPILKAEVIGADLIAEELRIETERNEAVAAGYAEGIARGYQDAEARILDVILQMQARQERLEAALVDVASSMVEALMSVQAPEEVLYNLANRVLSQVDDGQQFILVAPALQAQILAPELDRLVSEYSVVDAWTVDEDIPDDTLQLRSGDVFIPISLERRLRELHGILGAANAREADQRMETDEGGGIDG